MNIPKTNGIDCSPTNDDLEIASFGYRALTAVRDDGDLATARYLSQPSG